MNFPKEFLKATSHRDSRTTLNDNEYEFTVMMVNSDGEIMFLPNTRIHSLIINDNLSSPFNSGVVTIDNRLDIIGNFFKTALFPGMTETSKPKSFKFKHDGLDLVLIKIRPLFTDLNLPPGLDEKVFHPKIWDLSYIFSIYDHDEYHDKLTPDRKWKTLYLRDIKEQILTQSSGGWTSSRLLDKLNLRDQDINQVSNDRRGVQTGTCIKDIIKNAFKGSRMFDEDISNEFDKQWEEGGTRVFYSSPANSSPMDDIEYMLDRTISASNSDNCILRYERDRTWSLLPMSNYFDRVFTAGTRKPGDFIIDFFPIAGQAGPDDSSSNIAFDSSKIHGLSRSSFDVKMSPGEMDGIENWSLVDLSPLDSLTDFVSHAVHSYHDTDKTFSIDYEDHHIDKIGDEIRELYTDKMRGERNRPGSLLPISDFKKTNKIINHVYSSGDGSLERAASGRRKSGINKVLNRFISNSVGINFTMNGLSYRRSGRFISMVNTQTVPNVPFQDILQGEWLITGVTHTIVGSRYRNNITCVKPYAYRDIYKK